MGVFIFVELEDLLWELFFKRFCNVEVLFVVLNFFILLLFFLLLKEYSRELFFKNGVRNLLFFYVGVLLGFGFFDFVIIDIFVFF